MDGAERPSGRSVRSAEKVGTANWLLLLDALKTVVDQMNCNKNWKRILRCPLSFFIPMEQPAKSGVPFPNNIGMFGLFKKKSDIEKLQEQYQKLTKEAHQLSSVDRKKGDAKLAEAEEVAKKIDALRK